MILIAILVLPLIAAILCWIAAIGKRVAAPVTMMTCLILLALAVRVAFQVNAYGRVVGVPGWIEVDALGTLILLLVTVVGALACLYSLGYVPRMTRNKTLLYHYYGNLNLFIFSMLAVPVVVGPSVT